MDTVNFKKKICILGDGAVGKTSLIRKFVHDVFDDKYIATIGTKVTNKDMVFHNKANNKEYRLKLMIWDILGQPAFRNVKKSAYTGAAGAFLVCDLTRADTLKNTINWANGLMETVGDIPMALLVNKNDLMSRRAFEIDDVKAVASNLGASYYFTSAKTGRHVDEAFYVLGEMLIAEKDELTFYKPIKKTKEKRVRMNITLALDTIVDTYCTLHGGQERTMPVIREVFEENDIDFMNPSIGDLKFVVEKLTEITESYGGYEEAELERRKFMKIIQSLEKETGSG